MQQTHVLVQRPLLGIFMMILGIGVLNLMDGVGKWLVMDGVEVMQILALRSVVIVPLLLLYYVSTNNLTALKPNRPKAQALRGIIGFIAPFAFFLGVGKLPLTSAVVVFFSSIFMTTILSIFILGERPGKHRWSAIVVGYVGVIIAMSPAWGGDASGYILVLISSIFYAFLFVSGRKLSETESVSSLVLSYNLGVGVVALVLLPWFWVPLNMDQLVLIVLLSLLAVTGHFCITHAFAVAEATLIAPFEYTSILWTVALDMLIWQVLPGRPTWIGAVIIIASGLYVIYREARLGKQ